MRFDRAGCFWVMASNIDVLTYMWFLLFALGVCFVGYGIVHLRHRTPTSMDSSIDTFAQKRNALAPATPRRRR